jgi:hypothetical protein
MEQDFQTSFIPKKPLIDNRVVVPHQVSLLTLISAFIFFTMLLVSGGLYFYQNLTANKIKEMGDSLNLSKDRFEPSRIKELQVLDKRLKAVDEIFSGHTTIAPIFKILQEITMKTVGYNKFDYKLGAGKDSGSVMVKISGQAADYRSVALQADLFSKNENLVNPVFYNFSLDPQGNVLFDLDFSVDSNFVNYKQTLLTESQ